MLTISFATGEARCVYGGVVPAPASRETTSAPIIIVIWPSRVWGLATTGLRFGTRIARQIGAVAGRLVRTVAGMLRTQITIKVQISAGVEIARCI